MKKYEKVREKICSCLLDGTLHRGSLVPTEREMAAQLGVSRVTVRNAYCKLCDTGILTRGRGRAGTRISENFQGHAKTSRLVAVVSTLHNRFARSFIEAIQRRCLDHDLLAVLAVTPERSAEQSEMALGMVTRGIGNLVVWGFGRDLDFQLFERLRILGVNQVFFDRVAPSGGFADFVSLDNQHAVRTLLKYAENAWHPRRIVGIDIGGLQIDSSIERREELERECARYALPIDWRILPWCSTAQDRNILCRDLHDGDAVFAVNDTMALRVRRCLPDIRIISVDGTPEAADAGIVSYHQPIDRLAETVVAALLRQRQDGVNWKAGTFRVRGGLTQC